MGANPHILAALRRRLQASLTGPAGEADLVSFGEAALDAPLGGGLARAALHEIHAASEADAAAATGFALGLAARAAGTRPILWVRQDMLETEAGFVHAPGVKEFGLDPDRLLLVRAKDAEALLRAGIEAARCGALGAVLIAAWGEHRLFDLTASRRLSLAAAGSGVATLMLRVAAQGAPSAAATRWRVGAFPSRALEAEAPGAPAFALRLLRHRGGLPERDWTMEWDRDRHCFRERLRIDIRRREAPLSRPVAAVPADRPAAAADGRLRRAG